jgi:hypothetical protein
MRKMSGFCIEMIQSSARHSDPEILVAGQQQRLNIIVRQTVLLFSVAIMYKCLDSFIEPVQSSTFRPNPYTGILFRKTADDGKTQSVG